MKIIVAGFAKCGTKTLAQALRHLGYNVYDFMENYEFLGERWSKIFREGATSKDFIEMYKDVDAVTDLPCCFFWEELHQAFPDAKIVFMQRSSEDVWADSFEQSVRMRRILIFRMLKVFSPTAVKLRGYLSEMLHMVFGFDVMSASVEENTFNKLLTTKAYRRHNRYVLEHAPKDKLLVFDLADGWEPLCEFLQQSVPEDPFPHCNQKGNYGKELLQKHPVFDRMKKEFCISVGFFVCLLYAFLSKIVYTV